MNQQLPQSHPLPASPGSARLLQGLACCSLLLAPELLAQDFGGTDAKVCGFFDNINGLLNMISIAVVTIAVIFAGYQIAFAHKRISDVAPILIGGVLIGAAGQIARMLLGSDAGSCSGVVAAAEVLQQAWDYHHA